MTYTQRIVDQLREWADILEEQDLGEFYAMELSMQTGSGKAFQRLREGLSAKGADLERIISNVETAPYEALKSGDDYRSLRVRFAYLGRPDHED